MLNFYYSLLLRSPTSQLFFPNGNCVGLHPGIYISEPIGQRSPWKVVECFFSPLPPFLSVKVTSVFEVVGVWERTELVWVEAASSVALLQLPPNGCYGIRCGDAGEE